MTGKAKKVKGSGGELEVITILYNWVNEVRSHHGLPPLPKDDTSIHRNYNQSAQGGSDISNQLGLCIEVKRHENLSINTWWSQVTTAAEKEGGIPILMFRQNRKKWRIVMNTFCIIPRSLGPKGIEVRSEISLDDFEYWFKETYMLTLLTELNGRAEH
jgi:hypothetical protein